MEEREYITSLYEIYNKLLSQSEREYFENYYFEDLNLKEIADNNNISRTYVGKYIKQIEDKLIEYEKCLNIYEKNNKIREIIKFSDLKERIEEIL